MQLKEFDLSKVMNLAANKVVNQNPQSKHVEQPTKSSVSANTLDLNSLLNKVKNGTDSIKSDSKIANLIRNTINNINTNQTQKDNARYSEDNVEQAIEVLKVMLDDVKAPEDVMTIEETARTYYKKYREILQKRYNAAAQSIADLNNSPEMIRSKDSLDQIDFYNNHKDEWKEDTENPKIISLLNNISNNTSTLRMQELLDNFDNQTSMSDILNAAPETKDIEDFINSLPDNDEEDKDYNKTDFINNLSPETKNWFIKQKKMFSLSPVDTSILQSIRNYCDAKLFIETNKEYKKALDKIQTYKNLRHNLEIQNKNMVKDFLEIEKLLHRKKKQFRMSNDSAIIIPRKVK